MTLVEARSFGEATPPVQVYRGVPFQPCYVRREKLEVFVAEEVADAVVAVVNDGIRAGGVERRSVFVSTVTELAQTADDRPGIQEEDRRIFVSTTDEVSRVRTGGSGECAL
jgi:nitrogen regulatory protein PII